MPVHSCPSNPCPICGAVNGIPPVEFPVSEAKDSSGRTVGYVSPTVVDDMIRGYGKAVDQPLRFASGQARITLTADTVVDPRGYRVFIEGTDLAFGPPTDLDALRGMLERAGIAFEEGKEIAAVNPDGSGGHVTVIKHDTTEGWIRIRFWPDGRLLELWRY